jgi:hypothetical protein
MKTLHSFIRYCVLLCCSLAAITNGFAQVENYDFAEDIRFENHIYSDNIHTVLLQRPGIDLTAPIIELNSEQQLTLRFDDWSNNIEDYVYTFIHCDADWTPSSLLQMDYIEGFNEVYINNYSFSFNTTVPYVNYEFSFPNDDLELTRSGNYIVVVFDANNRERILLTQRFMISEPGVGLFPNLLQKYTHHLPEIQVD